MVIDLAEAAGSEALDDAVLLPVLLQPASRSSTASNVANTGIADL